MAIRKTLRISGHVQGVFFRQSAFEEARRLNLRGFVRNLPSGDVEAVAEGEPAALARFVSWCEIGPPAARVTGVEARDDAATGEFTTFEVRH